MNGEMIFMEKYNVGIIGIMLQTKTITIKEGLQIDKEKTFSAIEDYTLSKLENYDLFNDIILNIYGIFNNKVVGTISISNDKNREYIFKFNDTKFYIENDPYHIFIDYDDFIETFIKYLKEEVKDIKTNRL